MDRAGLLAFNSPVFEQAEGVPTGVVNPFTFNNPAAQSGSAALQPGLADIAAMGELGVRLARENQYTMPEMQQPSKVYFSPSRNTLAVQGYEFGSDNDAAILASAELLNQPAAGRPEGADWIPLDEATYMGVVQGIADPTRGRLFRENFATGLQQLKQLGGSALQLAGAEQFGGRLVESAQREIEKNAPFQREFTDIESGGDAVDWFVSVLGNQGPMILESVGAALAGAAAGSAIGGPGLGTAGGFLAGLFRRKAFKQGVLEAAAKKRAGIQLLDTETKLLREAAGIAGATFAALGSEYILGAGDVYGEMREQGTTPDDLSARFTAAAAAAPYAVLGLLPEFALAGRALGFSLRGGVPDALPKDAKLRQRIGRKAGSAAAAGLGYGLFEGTSEMGQEAIVLGASGQDLASPEAINRYINAFAAGAAIGGVSGAVAGLRTREPVDVLGSPEPTQGALPPPPREGVTVGGPEGPFYTGPRHSQKALPLPPQEGVTVGGPEGPFYTGPGRRTPVEPPPVQPGLLGQLPIEGVVEPRDEFAQIGDVPRRGETFEGTTVPSGYIGPPIYELTQQLSLTQQPSLDQLPVEGEWQPHPSFAQIGDVPRRGETYDGTTVPSGYIGPPIYELTQQPVLDQLPIEGVWQPHASFAQIGDVPRRGETYEGVAQPSGYLQAPAMVLPEGYAAFPPTPTTPFLPAPASPAAAPASPAAAPAAAPATAAQPTPTATPAAQAKPAAQDDAFAESAAAGGIFYGKKDGGVFANKGAASSQRKNVASRLGVKSGDLVAVKHGGGWVLSPANQGVADAIAAKEEQNAIQKRSATKVDAREQPKDGGGVRAQDAQDKKAPGKSKLQTKKTKKTSTDEGAGEPQTGAAKGKNLKRGEAKPAPATEAPATEAPATEAPATEAPATESPATEAKAVAPAAPKAEAKAAKGEKLKRDKAKTEAEAVAPATEAKATKGDELRKDAAKKAEAASAAAKPAPVETKAEAEAEADGMSPEAEWVELTDDGEGNLEFGEYENLNQWQQAAWAKLVAQNKASYAHAERIAVTMPPEKKWEDIAPPGIEELYGTLTEEQKAQWTEIVYDGKASYDTAAELYGGETPSMSPEELFSALTDGAKFNPLSTAEKNEWRKLVESGKAKRYHAERLAYSEETADELVELRGANSEISELSPASPTYEDDYKASVRAIITARFSSTSKVVQNLAGGMLDSLEKNDYFDSALVDYAVGKGKFNATHTSKGTKRLTPLYALLESRGLVLEAIKNGADIKALPEQDKVAIDKVLLKKSQYGDNHITDSPEAKLAGMIQDAVAADNYSNIKADADRDAMESLWKKVTDKAFVVNSNKYTLKEHFTKDGKLKQDPETKKPTVGATTYEEKLAREIRRVVDSNAEERTKVQADGDKKLMERLWENVADKDYEVFAGKPLKDYFTEDGGLKQHPESRKPTTGSTDFTKVTEEAAATKAAIKRAEDRVLTFADYEIYEAYGIKPRSNANDDADADANANDNANDAKQLAGNIAGDADANANANANDAPHAANELNFNGNFALGSGKRVSPLPLGRIRLLTADFVKKLKVKPKTKLYKDQADMKRRNPSLYAQAVASRPEGDFDMAPAVGFSFGDGNVIIFTDRIVTEQQLKFVLAHETLGHFGFRGLLAQSDLNAALDRVYNESETVKAAVDTRAEVTGISRREATEEYLADMAGTLQTNLLARFWFSIKNGLNKLGVAFDDDFARYLVSQSRKYVRSGKLSGQPFVPSQFGKAVYTMESGRDPYNSGRYALAQNHYDQMNRVAAGRAQQSVDGFLSLHQMADQIRKAKINTSDLSRRVIGELKTMNYSARENLGYRKLYEVLRNTVQRSNELKSKYNDMLAVMLRPSFTAFGVKVGGNANQQEIDKINRMATATSDYKLRQMTEAKIREYNNLITVVDGEASVNEEVFEKLKAQGRMKLEDFRRGFKYTVRVARAMDADGIAEINANRQAALNLATTDEERAAINKEYDKQTQNEVHYYEQEMPFDAMPDLTEDSNIWKGYNAMFDTMAESAVDLLMANYTASKHQRLNIEEVASSIMGRPLTTRDKRFLGKLEDKYTELYTKGAKVGADGRILYDFDQIEAAETFAKEFNQALTSPTLFQDPPFLQAFDEAQRQEIYDDIVAFRKDTRLTNLAEGQRFKIQNMIQDLVVVEVGKQSALHYAIRTIGGYIPFGREGKWQARIQAVDPDTGRPYKITERFRVNMVYMQFDDEYSAQVSAETINETLGGADGDNIYEVEVVVDGKAEVRQVKLVAVVETARTTPESTFGGNLNEVMATVMRMGINLTPKERKKVIISMSNQGARARTRLERAGTPGYDPNTLKYVSQHLDGTASIVARKEHRVLLDNLFDDSLVASRNLWRGSELGYRKRRDAWRAAKDDPSMSPEEKKAIEMDYIDYHYTYKIKDSQKYYNRYLDMGRRAVAFLDSQDSIEFSDLESNDAVSRLKMITTFFQLGGSVATGALNLVSLVTNVLPYLTTYNRTRNFGGGFGLGEASTSLAQALAQVKDHKQSEIGYWNDLLSGTEQEVKKKVEAIGLTVAEAKFMQKEVGSGTMQAALLNALLGSARGRITTAGKQKFIQAWMFAFSYTEQMSRRGTGLAAFRLAYQRAIAGNKTPDEAFDIADRFAIEAIDNTLGEYAMFNRPAFFRGDLRQFLFMYQMFPLTSVLLMRNLPREGALMMLGILMILGGLKALPFGDDLMDLIDTIGQGLGLGPSALWKGSAEKSVASLLDELAPGMTPIAMRGILNHILPVNASDRVSLANMLPGTGIALPNANVGREMMDIFGPVASMLTQSVATLGAGAKMIAGKTGIAPDTTSFASILRSSPITMLRAMGDMMVYDDTGAIVSQKGYVISRDLTTATYIGRALGFYPAAAVRENDVIRVIKRVSDYSRDVSATFQNKYIAAKLMEDKAAGSRKAREVVDMVREWNAAAKGTGLEIKNFLRNANRGYQEARKPAVKRFLRTVPVGARADVDVMLRAYGVE